MADIRIISKLILPGPNTHLPSRIHLHPKVVLCHNKVMQRSFTGSSSTFEPAYLALYRSGELQQRAVRSRGGAGKLHPLPAGVRG